MRWQLFHSTLSATYSLHSSMQSKSYRIKSIGSYDGTWTRDLQCDRLASTPTAPRSYIKFQDTAKESNLLISVL